MSSQKQKAGPEKRRKPKEKRGRKSTLHQYDEELVEMYNRRFQPGKIAEVLWNKHDLLPETMNWRNVSNQLNYIQTNQLYPLAPVNEPENLLAKGVDPIYQFFFYPPPPCKLSFCDLIFSDSFWIQGHQSAKQVASTLQTEEDEDEPIDEIDVLDDEALPEISIQEYVYAHFCDAGFIYQHEGHDQWSLFLAWTLTADVSFDDPEENGVTVHWKAEGPSDQDLKEAQSITECSVQEYNLTNTTASVFIPSPAPLSQDLSQIKKGEIPKGPNAKWLVVSIPFKDEELKECAVLEHLDVSTVKIETPVVEDQ